MDLGPKDYVNPEDFTNVLATWGFKRSCHWGEADRSGEAPAGYEDTLRTFRIYRTLLASLRTGAVKRSWTQPMEFYTLRGPADPLSSHPVGARPALIYIYIVT